MKTAFDHKRRKLVWDLLEAKLDCVLITSPANWYYLTGFTGDAGALVVSRKGTTLVTDGRFSVQSREETHGVRIVVHKGSIFESIGKVLQKSKLRRAGFDPSQLTVAQLRDVRRHAGHRVHWVPARGMVESLRMHKDSTEITQIRKAARLAGEIMVGALALLKPGLRESELAAEIEYQMRKRGASGAAFETIVAFGKRSALPHARPTAKRLRKNELVVLDLGVILGHYCSDITRTVYVGQASERIRTWYQAVREAQAAAIATAKSGVACGDVDAAARKVLAAYRLDHLFVHSTGHGLGLEVHEDPRIARGHKQLLKSGNVVTIEPGVYAEGIGGIRIEDDVAVQAGRAEVLTRVPRDLIEI